MSKVDRLLEVLDGGLQRSPEASYGQDHDQSLCARCRRYPHVVDGDLCALCRVFLLGDSDDDPVKLSLAQFDANLVEAFHQFARRG